jgi:phosphatidate cytidylyltransferase
MKSLSHLGVPVLLLAFSAYELREKGESGMLGILLAVAGLLLFFTSVSALLHWKKAAMAQEVGARTETWWWMAAVFMLAFSTHRIVSFLFLGFLCFSALREYFSLLPMRDASTGQILSFRDRPSILLAYCMVPLSIYVAYIRWYELFIILVPVYFFLLIPILFVIQDRTEGALKSMGAISLGTLFFAFCLGHALFMINAGPMLLFFCFFLTESRDVIAFWVGKALGALSCALPEGIPRRLLERRIAPTVNPRKTWAGGLLSALAVSGLAVAVQPLLPPFGGSAVPREFCAAAGFAIGFLGLFGDLVFGMVKRDIGVKDTGSLLPGHGGVIDRVNGLVFTVPLTFHLFYWRFF